ncbi:hypothetical protein JCM10207_001791 [Rhodosporidiobolus poonsookiae]
MLTSLAPVLAAVGLLAGSATASPVRSHVGCYGGNPSTHPIVQDSSYSYYALEGITVEKAFAEAIARHAGGLWIASNEYGVASGLYPDRLKNTIDESKCLYGCEGAPGEACGRLGVGYPVYQYYEIPPVPVPVATHYSNAKWTYKGCYTGLAPSNRASGLARDSAGKCLGTEDGQPFDQIYGAIKGSDCWGLRTLGKAVKVDDSECDTPCTGNSTQLCGNVANNRYEVFDRVLPRKEVKVVKAAQK